jgi:hypothetical protein
VALPAENPGRPTDPTRSICGCQAFEWSWQMFGIYRVIRCIRTITATRSPVTSRPAHRTFLSPFARSGGPAATRQPSMLLGSPKLSSDPETSALPPNRCSWRCLKNGTSGSGVVGIEATPSSASGDCQRPGTVGWKEHPRLVVTRTIDKAGLAGARVPDTLHRLRQQSSTRFGWYDYPITAVSRALPARPYTSSGQLANEGAVLLRREDTRQRMVWWFRENGLRRRRLEFLHQTLTLCSAGSRPTCSCSKGLLDQRGAPSYPGRQIQNNGFARSSA